jgi:hypothetical protein
MICHVFREPAFERTAGGVTEAAGQWEPKARWSDAQVDEGDPRHLAVTPFHGDGSRKTRARFAHRGLVVSSAVDVGRVLTG